MNNTCLTEITVKIGDSRRIVDLIDRINVKIHGYGPDVEPPLKFILLNCVEKLVKSLRMKPRIKLRCSGSDDESEDTP